MPSLWDRIRILQVITLGEAMAYVLSGMYGPVKAGRMARCSKTCRLGLVSNLPPGLGSRKCDSDHPPAFLCRSHCDLALTWICQMEDCAFLNL